MWGWHGNGVGVRGGDGSGRCDGQAMVPFASALDDSSTFDSAPALPDFLDHDAFPPLRPGVVHLQVERAQIIET